MAVMAEEALQAKLRELEHELEVCLESTCTYMYLTRPAHAHTNIEQEGDITRKG